MTEYHATPEPNTPYGHSGPNADILMLLSAYIDGELADDPENLSRIESLLDSDAHVKAAFLKLQQLQHRVCQASETAYESDKINIPDCWSNIASQLDADAEFCQELEPLALSGESASPEFLSAYYDGEVPRTSPGVQAFEAQLPQDVKAGKTLADWLALSRLLKGYIYRLEEACRIDLTPSVMNELDRNIAFNDSAPEDILDPGNILELMSAYFDGDGLSEKEKARASSLLETREDCKRFALFHRQLREGIARNVEVAQSQAPEADWFRLELAIERDFAKRKSNKLLVWPARRKWVANASIAASFLLIAVAGFKLLPSFTIPSLSPPLATSNTSDKTSLVASSDSNASNARGNQLPTPFLNPSNPNLSGANTPPSQDAANTSANAQTSDSEKTDFFSAALARLAGAASAIQPSPVGPDEAFNNHQGSSPDEPASIVVASASQNSPDNSTSTIPREGGKNYPGNNWPRSRSFQDSGNQYVAFSNSAQNPFAFLPNQYVPAAPPFIFRTRQPLDTASHRGNHGYNTGGYNMNEITFVSNSQGSSTQTLAKQGQIIGGSRLSPDNTTTTSGENVAVKITPLKPSTGNAQVPSSEAYLIEVMQDEHLHLHDHDVEVLYDL